jgi:hypothetical protein
MAMINYLQSGRRHLHDARVLERQTPPRLDNADQLYGLGVECLLKALLVRHAHVPVPVDDEGSIRWPFRIHTDRLWPSVLVHLHGRPAASYAGLLGTGHPFNDYSVDQRYEEDGVGATRIGPHRVAAARVERALDAAVIAGEVKL